MRRLLTVALLVIALLPVGAGRGDACSYVVVELDELVEQLVSGEADSLPRHERIVGILETRVVKEWTQTPDHRAASARVAVRTWGVVPDQEVIIQGGEVDATYVTSSCPGGGANPVGTREFFAFWGDSDNIYPIHDLRTVPVQPHLDLFTAAFGAPTDFEVPELPDHHPSEPPLPAAVAGSELAAPTTESESGGAGQSTDWPSALGGGVAVMIALLAAIAISRRLHSQN